LLVAAPDQRRTARARNSPERWGGVCVPSLATLRARNGDFDDMHVQVAQVPGKGLGLIARVDIDEGVLVAYYLSKLFKRRFTSSTYWLSSGATDTILDVFDHSFPPPDADGVPYVAPLVNEPTGVDGGVNCVLTPVPLPDEEGTIRRHGLFTTHKVRKGEELVWDYGPGYGERSYPNKHNKK